MIKLTAKIMEERLKHGWTIKFFAQNYQITEEEFLTTLSKTFSSKAYKGMLARLKKNEKIFQRKEGNFETRETVLPETSSGKLNKQLETTIEEQTNIQEDSNLQSIQSQQETLQETLNSLELKHKTLSSERVQIRNNISKYKTVLLEMQTKICQYQEELKDLVSELDEKFASMQKINLSISETRVALSEVNAKIDALQKVSIFFYSSGEFAIESQISFEIPEWATLFDKIVKDELVESLTIKQIKGLSKCVVLVRLLKTQNFKYEIAFEDSNVEFCFEKILKVEEI